MANKIIQISSKKPFDIYKAVKERYPDAVAAHVCAFGIVTNWYENKDCEKKIAEELYTKCIDKDSFSGVETTFQFID